MHRLTAIAVATAIAAGSVAAAPSARDLPIDGEFGKVTTLVADGDRVGRLELDHDAVLLQDDDALVDGHAPVEFTGGHDDYFALLISPRVGDTPWSATIVVEDIADHGHLHMDAIGDRALFEGNHRGYLLRAGVYDVAVLAGIAGSVTLRLVTPELDRSIPGNNVEVDVERPAATERRDVEPTTTTTTPTGETYWGGAETFEATETMIALGGVVARIDPRGRSGRVNYTLSECNWNGDQSIAIFAPGMCASFNGLTVVSGTTGTYSRVYDDVFKEGWSLYSSKDGEIQTLGASFTVDNPAEVRAHVVLFETAAA